MIVLVVVGLFLVSAWAPQMLRRSGVVFVIGVFVFRALVPSLLGTIRSLFTGLDNDPSIQGRIDDYGTVFTFISRRPWLGRGPGTFDQTQYLLLDNNVLGSLVQIGYLGFMAFALIFITACFVALRLAYRGPSNEVRHLGVALAGAIMGSAVSLYFADMEFFAHWIGPTFLILGLIGALDRFRDEPSEAAGGRVIYMKQRRRVGQPIGAAHPPALV